MIRAILLLSALLASTCEVGPFPKPAPQPSPPSPWDTPSDAATPPDEVDAASHTPCYLACQKLASLGCPEAKPTAAGATCTQVCNNAESSGVLSMNPSCVAHAESCSIAKACSSQ
jgi:hypothetical protein